MPQYEPVVRIEGGVNRPVSVAYVPHHGVLYCIDHAGGFSRRADRNQVEPVPG